MSANLLTSTGYEIRRSIFLAQASQMAYEEDHAKIETWARQQGFPGAAPINTANVQGYWAVQGDAALLVFRGTQNPAHWLRNVRVLPWPHRWGLAHEGFVDGIDDIQHSLRTFLTAARGANHIWITGHSLGGALAVVAAAWLKIHGSRNASVSTYGQPPVAVTQLGFPHFGDRFMQELPGGLHRFVNQSDIVPRALPTPPYRHFGIVKRIVRPGVIVTETLAQILTTVPASPPVTTAPLESPAAADGAALLAAQQQRQQEEEARLPAPALIENEAPQFSISEFQALQTALGAPPPGAPLETLPLLLPHTPATEGPALEGILPDFNPAWIKDHAIAEYIRLLQQIRDQG